MRQHKTINTLCRLLILSAVISVAVCAGGCASAEMKGTPFYTGDYTRPQGPPEDRVNLWPVAYYHEPALSLLWPVGEWTDDHWAARPFVSVYKLDQEEREYNFLWPLCQFDFDKDHHRVFPVFFGKYKNENSYLVVFPLAWYEEDSHFALFPAYIGAHDDETRDTHILWPVFNRQSGEQEYGWRVWPLAGDYHDEDERYRFALWPIFHEIRNGDNDIRRLALPLYWSHHQADEGWNLAVPLLWRSYDDETALTLSWLYSAGRDGDDKWSMIFPLYFHEKDGETQRLLTPLFGKTSAPDCDTWILTPLLSSCTSADDWNAFWFLAPLVHARWGGGDARHHFFPLYYRDSTTKTFISLPASWGKWGNGRFANALGPLFFYWSEGEHWQAHALFPFFSIFNKQDSGFWFWPLFGRWQNKWTKRGYALWPLLNWKRSATNNSTTIFPLCSWSDWDGSQTQKKEPKQWRKGWDWWCLPTVFSHLEQRYKRGDSETAKPILDHEERGNMLWPLWEYERDSAPARAYEKTEFSLLYWLYDYRAVSGAKLPEGKTENRARARILWRIMHYERQGVHKTLDIFPFITWDKKEDTGYRKLSFIWRLLRYQREDTGHLNLDLLFLPVWRGNGGD